MSENNEEKSFSVKDRRSFTEEGEVRVESPAAENGRQAEAPAGVQQQEAPRDDESQKDVREDTMPLPEINFPGFVLSLHTSALFHFGVLKDPVSGQTAKNLHAAKQTIDILGMLQKKTAGNLDENEQKLIEGILFELRIMYVKETEKNDR